MTQGMKNRVFLTEKDNIEKYENNLVTIKFADGKVFEALEPRRLFPVSRINSFITFLDEDGKEIAVLKGLNDINEKSRKTVKDSLEDYYLVPYISSIISITEKSGTLVWKVETNRGIKQFEVRDRNHDIRVYNDGRIRVRDSDDNRYVIEDFNALDKHSKGLLSSDI